MHVSDENLDLLASRTARSLLGPGTDRWRHTATVARRAGLIAEVLELPDARIVVASAWLHDIGYAAPLQDTGFHPVDGARHLAATGWPPPVVTLVAHHSGACYVAAVRGLSAALAEWESTNDVALDVLTYADQTTGPSGSIMDFEARMADTLRRRGPTSPSTVAHPDRAPYLRTVRDRVEAALRVSPRRHSAVVLG